MVAIPCFSVAQSCLTLCDPMDCSMLGFLVLHHLLEFAHSQWWCTILQQCWKSSLINIYYAYFPGDINWNKLWWCCNFSAFGASRCPLFFLLLSTIHIHFAVIGSLSLSAYFWGVWRYFITWFFWRNFPLFFNVVS